MNTENTNWGQSVTAVVIKDNKVLLARHTYGGGKGMLIIPGGYVEKGETPQDAVIREFKEETNITIQPKNSIHGALLRMNRSIQSEGAFGTIKWNRAYTRARRRGIPGLLLEIAMISCGFNLHKYHLKKLAASAAA